MLMQKEVRRLFDYDPITGMLTRRLRRSHQMPGYVVGKITTSGHLQVMIYNKYYMVHRLVWLWVHGVLPTGEIDHINRNPVDNRLSNLRAVSRSENQQNRKLHDNNSSGFTGVHKQKTMWTARIGFEGKRIFLGRFSSPELASQAYQAAKLIYHPTAPQT